jgi:transcriptional regulator with XRE-family HTH domain
MRQKQIPEVGVKLHMARLEQRLSLRDLATKAGVSASLLSQIESGKVVPSVASLFRVATALELPINTFFPADEHKLLQTHESIPKEAELTPKEIITEQGVVQYNEHYNMPARGPIVHPQTRKVIEFMEGITWAHLTAEVVEGFEFIEIHYNVGATTGPEMLHHIGKEFGLVLEGELQLDLGFDHHILKSGDSLIFDSAIPHRLTNIGQVPVRGIWCVFNPSILFNENKTGNPSHTENVYHGTPSTSDSKICQ